MPDVYQYYFKYLCNQEKEEQKAMKEFLNVESTVKKTQTWADDIYTYVLLSQHETTLQEGTDDEITGYINCGFRSRYQLYRSRIQKRNRKNLHNF